MPGKKRPGKPSEGGPVMVILEEIRSQNRATIEAVEVTRDAVRVEMQQLRAELVSRLEALEAAVRQNSTDIGQLKTEVTALKEQVSRLEAVVSGDYRERLHRLEQRMEALERGSA